MANSKPLSFNKYLLHLLYRTGKLAIDSVTISQDITRWHKAFMSGGLSYVNQMKRLRNKKSVAKTLRHLKYLRLIQTKKIGDRLIITLTSRGKEIALRETIRQSPKNSAGYYTVVVFDIPETQRLARQQLRIFLKSCNFKKLQLSVWASPQDVVKPLAQLIGTLKIDAWVNVFRAHDFFRQPK